MTFVKLSNVLFSYKFLYGFSIKNLLVYNQLYLNVYLNPTTKKRNLSQLTSP